MVIPPLSSTCVPGKQPRETYRRLVIADDLAQGFVHQGVRHCLRLLCADRLGNLSPRLAGGVSMRVPNSHLHLSVLSKVLSTVGSQLSEFKAKTSGVSSFQLGRAKGQQCW